MGFFFFLIIEEKIIANEMRMAYMQEWSMGRALSVVQRPLIPKGQIS